jgi:hypothetical protein
VRSPDRPNTPSLLTTAGDPLELVSSFAFNEFEKLKTFIKDNTPTHFPLTSCENVLTTLMRQMNEMAPYSSQISLPHQQRNQLMKLLKEIYSVANIIFESGLTMELKDFDGLVPFLGPTQWPSLKQKFATLSPPAFSDTLLIKLATFLITHSDFAQLSDPGFVSEYSKLMRNCCLLGDDQTTGIFLSHVNKILHWLEFTTLHPIFIAQAIGLLAKQASEDHSASIWRVLQHKIESSSEHAKITAITSSTAVLVGLLPMKQDQEALHMLRTHWKILARYAFVEKCTAIAVEALESMGTLASCFLPRYSNHEALSQQSLLNFPQLLNQIGVLFPEVHEELHRLIFTESLDPAILAAALQTLSKLSIVDGCDSGSYFSLSLFFD